MPLAYKLSKYILFDSAPSHITRKHIKWIVLFGEGRFRGTENEYLGKLYTTLKHYLNRLRWYKNVDFKCGNTHFACQVLNLRHFQKIDFRILRSENDKDMPDFASNQFIPHYSANNAIKIHHFWNHSFYDVIQLIVYHIPLVYKVASWIFPAHFHSGNSFCFAQCRTLRDLIESKAVAEKTANLERKWTNRGGHGRREFEWQVGRGKGRGAVKMWRDAAKIPGRGAASSARLYLHALIKYGRWEKDS